MTKNKIYSIGIVLLLIAAFVVGCQVTVLPDGTTPDGDKDNGKESKISRFSSGDELLDAFEEARERNQRRRFGEVLDSALGVMKSTAVAESAAVAPQAEGDDGRDFSETNVQVEGVDEADIIKTDGDYIYTLAQGNLVIARAYPANKAKIESTTHLNNFYPRELFIHDDKLLIFGSSSYNFDRPQEKNDVPRQGEKITGESIAIDRYYPSYRSFMTVKLFDISDKEEPELIRTMDFEGSYLTSRKIGSDAYFVVNSYPRYWDARPICEDIVPMYREATIEVDPAYEDLEPVVPCTNIGYIEPIQAENFITIASISMEDEDADVNKEVIVGSGQNVYASLENMYVAQTSWPRYNAIGELTKSFVEKTIITKFELHDGEIEFFGTGSAKGHILNQFSMDEYDEHFRIATTSGNFWQGESANNVYVLDEDLEVVGSLEDIAPGEKIYSVRFMGKKGYIVTFKKVDPLFVIDLGDPEDPEVLGKLKIPGYSDYLHPYDENHIIGIGKDTVEAEEGLKESRQLDFAWYQGVKMAIFDVSDVENPIEMHKVIIGDRGTDSPALHDHKAFLFDRERNLMVLPINLAEIKGEKSRDNQYGDFVFQGAYVYNVNLEDGFDLRGRVTHYDDDEVFKKSGFYFRGNSAIKRTLYIEDVLYTLSDNRLQLNDLGNLERLEILEFEKGNDRGYPEVMY